MVKTGRQHLPQRRDDCHGREYSHYRLQEQRGSLSTSFHPDTHTAEVPEIGYDGITEIAPDVILPRLREVVQVVIWEFGK